MDRTEEILREQLKVDKAVGFGKLMWNIHKNTLKKCMEIYVEEQLLLHNVVEQSGQFSFADMRDAFNAGDKYRLYLDKNAIGMGAPYDKDIPSINKVIETMSFEKWIQSKR